MEKFIKPTFSIKQTENSKQNIETFILSPLERGFANTLGHSLRRVLLSNIPAASAFAIKIRGIKHEFQAISNCDQDVVGIVLKIKQLEIKPDFDLINPNEFIELKLVSKKGPVFAKDIDCPTGIEILNKNLLIATTSKDEVLTMSIYVKIGRGYKTYEENRKVVESLLGKQPGIISIDSEFTPIKKINYQVETVNPGQDVEQERLVISLETRSGQKAEDILAIASKILISHFEQLLAISSDNFSEKTFKGGLFAEKNEATKPLINTTTNHSISELELSVRSFNALKNASIETIDELISNRTSELKQIKNLGEKSIEELIEKVEELGYKFREE